MQNGVLPSLNSVARDETASNVLFAFDQGETEDVTVPGRPGVDLRVGEAMGGNAAERR